MNRSPLLAVGLLLLPALFGCQLHQATSLKPTEPLPTAFSHAPAEGTAGNDLSQPWWHTFRDQELNRLMGELLDRNLDIKQAYARLAQLEATSRATDASLFPFLNLAAQSSRDRQPATTGGGDPTSSTQKLSLAAGYEIDLWQKLKNQRSAARLTADASREDIKTLYLTLTSQAADLYFLAREQRAQIELTDAIVKNLATVRDQVELRYRQGIAESLDLYQANQALAAAQSQRPPLVANLATTEHALATLLGHFPETMTEQNADDELPAAPPLFDSGLPSRLMQQRPDIQAAQLRVRAVDANVASAIAARFPAVNLAASLGTSRIDYGPSALHSTFWSLLIGLTQPIIDGGRLRAEQDRQQARLAEVTAAYQQTVLKAFQEVEDALIDNQTVAQQIKLLQAETEAARATRRRAEEGYRQGLNTYLVVLDAQRQDQQVRSRLLTARRRLLSARIGLARTLGGDWLDQTLANNLPPKAQEDSAHAR